MGWSLGWARMAMTGIAAVGMVVGGGALAPGAAQSAPAVAYGRSVAVAPGVSYRSFTVTASHGLTHGHLVTADLSNRHVRVDLLTPGAVAARAKVTAMADARAAVAAVNGDFFNISETQHPGVEATGASSGPAIASGRPLKAAVPDGQRFGPTLPPGTSARDVIGVNAAHTGRLDRLTLEGTVDTREGRLRLDGLNQYAVPVDGIGAFTPKWGSASRARAACGTDTARGAPCTQDTYEVTVRQGRVVDTSAVPGGGPIPAGTFVLLGREKGAAALRALQVGDRAGLGYRLRGRRGPLAFAVGGMPVLRARTPLDGLDDRTAATRTGAAIGDHGHRLYLLALNGAAETDSGLTLAELARLLRDMGADDGVNLDGGGSTTLATRAPGDQGVVVRNRPPGSFERAVPNGIGVFTRP
ncbi:phosphodiester glycosidase family protein [Streptomyces crystallinus]|uniref:Phosphodiester glycosidase domain-containing protein n=1 Tax=Streptomyces crystallinus TaxID=68191 RepID=A0ABP3Q8P9_9ACTN